MSFKHSSARSPAGARVAGVSEGLPSRGRVSWLRAARAMHAMRVSAPAGRRGPRFGLSGVCLSFRLISFSKSSDSLIGL